MFKLFCFRASGTVSWCYNEAFHPTDSVGMWKISDGANLHNASVFLYCPANFTIFPLLPVNIFISDIQ